MTIYLILTNYKYFSNLSIFNIRLLLSLKNRLVSSVNNINSVINEVLTISFIKIKNSKGPKINPCGANLEFILFIENIVYD